MVVWREIMNKTSHLAEEKEIGHEDLLNTETKKSAWTETNDRYR